MHHCRLQVYVLYTIFSWKQVLNRHLWKINHGVLSVFFFGILSTFSINSFFVRSFSNFKLANFDLLLRWSTSKRHWFNQFTFRAFSSNTLPLVITIFWFGTLATVHKEFCNWISNIILIFFNLSHQWIKKESKI